MERSRTLDEWSVGNRLSQYYDKISNGRVGNYTRNALSKASEYRSRINAYNERKWKELEDWVYSSGNDNILKKIIYDVLIDDDEGLNWNRDLQNYWTEKGYPIPSRHRTSTAGNKYNEKIREIGHRIATAAQQKGTKWFNSWKKWAERQEGDLGKIFQSIFGIAEEEYDEDEHGQEEPTMNGLRQSVDKRIQWDDVQNAGTTTPIQPYDDDRLLVFTPQEADDIENLSVKMHAEVKRVIKSGYFNGPKLTAIAKRFMNLLNRKFRQAKASQGQAVNECYTATKGMLDEIAREVYAADTNIIGTMDALLQQIRQYVDEGHFTPREMNTVHAFYRAISYVKRQAKGYATRMSRLAARQQQLNSQQPIQ